VSGEARAQSSLKMMIMLSNGKNFIAPYINLSFAQVFFVLEGFYGEKFFTF
jgi:hypothetical protein